MRIDFYESRIYRGKQKQFFVEQDNLNVKYAYFNREQIPITVSILLSYLRINRGIHVRVETERPLYNDNLSQLKLDRTTNVVTFFKEPLRERNIFMQ